MPASFAPRKCGGCGATDHDGRNCEKLGKRPKAPRKTSEVQRPYRRRSRPRSKVIAVKRMTRAALAVDALSEAQRDELAAARPRTRDDCRDAPRPCPFVGCKHHLYLDVNPETGSIKMNFPELEPWDLAESCTLDRAELGGITLEEVGLITNLTRERVRQLEVRGLLKLRQDGRMLLGHDR